MSNRILAIDDDDDIRFFLSAVLGESHAVTEANSGEAALQLLDDGTTFDLILLDVIMPDMTGYDVISLIKRHPNATDTPVIFLTGRDSQEEEEKGLQLGAVDYIAKPISVPVLLARVDTHLSLKAARDHLANQNHILDEKVRARTRELALTQDVTILSLASLAETRDNETGNHIRRTQAYVRILAEHLADGTPYAQALDDDTIALLEKSAALHDIGKVGVPDAILKKPGKLTAEEHDIIKQHTYFGYSALENAESMLGSTSFLRHAKDIAYYHHEKWDGSGYPKGLKAEETPLSARLMAVADVYDALISKRVYKPAMSHQTALDLISDGKGSHFDPVIVDALMAGADAFEKAAAKFADRD